jgi:hypothetical protein
LVNHDAKVDANHADMVALGLPNISLSLDAATQQACESALSYETNDVSTHHFSAAVVQHDPFLEVYKGRPVQRMMVDTGNQPLNIVGTHHNPDIVGGHQSTATFLGAFGDGVTRGDISGSLPITVLSTTSKDPSLMLDVTSIDAVRTDLMSFFAMYKKGFDLHITLDEARMEHRETGQIIPLFLCPETNAWYMVYTIGDFNDDALVSYVHNKSTSESGEPEFYADYWGDDLPDPDISATVNANALCGDDIEKMEQAELPELGDKGCLGPKHRGTARTDLHRLHGHQGYDKNCETCRRLRRRARWLRP